MIGHFPLHLSQNPQSCSKMSHKASEPKPITNSYGVKMLGVTTIEKGTSKKNRVSESNDIDDEIIMFLDPKPLNMIGPIGISTVKSKSVSITRKKKKYEKLSTSEKEPYGHVYNIAESMTINEEVQSH